jgi:mannose/fructose/N-acetylgalactosamine-specific phosphotransferase system component IIC
MIAEFWPLMFWGLLVGLDLTIAPQIGLSRPIVAGAVAGLLVGDVQSGIVLGAVLELFALDFLPVGASKYPDYGIGAIAGVVVLSHAPVTLGLGLAVFVGLVIAYVGGKGIHLVRHSNAAGVLAVSEDLDSDNASVVNILHLKGLLRGGVRSLLVTGFGIGVALLARAFVHPSARMAVLATLVALGAGLAASLGGAVNVAGRTPGLRMYLIGLSVGLVWVVVA